MEDKYKGLAKPAAELKILEFNERRVIVFAKGYHVWDGPPGFERIPTEHPNEAIFRRDTGKAPASEIKTVLLDWMRGLAVTVDDEKCIKFGEGTRIRVQEIGLVIARDLNNGLESPLIAYD